MLNKNIIINLIFIIILIIIIKILNLRFEINKNKLVFFIINNNKKMIKNSNNT